MFDAVMLMNAPKYKKEVMKMNIEKVVTQP